MIIPLKSYLCAKQDVKKVRIKHKSVYLSLDNQAARNHIFTMPLCFLKSKCCPTSVTRDLIRALLNSLLLDDSDSFRSN